MGRVRISDVAKAAGVSGATVSLALNDVKGRVSQTTKAKILRVAREIGYTPDPIARGLRTQQTRTVGLVADRVATTAFAGKMISGAQAVARAHDHLLILIDTDGHPDDEERAIETLRTHRVDGLIYARMFHQVVDAPENLPENAVYLNCRPPDLRGRAVVPDEYAGGRAATQVLADAGHRRIAYIASSSAPLPLASAIRERGYADVLTDSGIVRDPALTIEVPNTAQGGHDAMVRLWSRRAEERPTAVFAFNDQVAMGIYSFAARNGIVIPRDLSVMGFDDLDLIAPELDPGLSTVALPHEAMGRWAMQAALGLEPDGADDPVHLMSCPVIERDSVSARAFDTVPSSERGTAGARQGDTSAQTM